MSAQDVSAILSAVAWPVVALLILLVVRKPLAGFVDSADTMEFRVAGSEAKFTRREAKQALGDLIDQLNRVSADLTPEDRDTFTKILSAKGTVTVEQLIPGFTRDSPAHQSLRTLRDATLIRPKEGGKWRPEKHPVVTRFGELVSHVVPELTTT